MMKEEEGSDDSGKINETMVISRDILSKLPEYPDIMFKVFTFWTPKDLYKFKCVSKGIRRLIEEPIFKFEHFKRLKATSSLNTVFINQVLREPYKWEKPVLVSMYGIDTKLLLPDSTLDYLRVHRHRGTAIVLLESCDGLILCAEFCYRTDEFTVYVHNPLTMEKVLLHHVHGAQARRRLYYKLFAQCSSSTGYIHYKVICVYQPKCIDDQTKFSELLVFSSETGEWNKVEKKLPPLSDKIGVEVFIEDVMYWDCLEGYILVFYFKKSKSGRWFDLIQSPKAELKRCLWDYEGKLYCYCHGYEQEEEYFTAWVLCSDHNKFEWKKGKSKRFKKLTEDIRKKCEKSSETVPQVVPEVPSPVPLDIEVLMYDPSLKTIYLLITDAIFSYEFKKRKLERKIQFPRVKDIQFGTFVSYIQCMMPMEIARKTDHAIRLDDGQEEEHESISSHESSITVPGIDQEFYLDELISQYKDLATMSNPQDAALLEN